MQELVNKSPDQILLRLAQEGGGLKELLRNRAISNQRIHLLLRLIQKSFTAQMLQFQYGNIQSIVDIVLQSDFLNYTLYIILKNDGQRTEDENRMVVSSTLALVEFAMQLSPKFAVPKVVQFQPLLRDQSRYLESEKLLAQLQRFETALKKCEQQDENRAETGRRGNRSRGMSINADDDRPAETFRELPLIPTERDLTANEQIFVRRNRDDGRYDNLEDYLDVQFRLFRADFIIPLRENICKYLGAHDAEGPQESGRRVKAYNDVQIVRPVCTDKDLSYRLSFDVSRFSSVDWHTSRRLRYGSLLCLSCDNFQTFLCAVVHERDASLLSNGLVDVVFILTRHELRQVVDVPRDQRFVMVESPAYFEAYRHVLQGLTNLNDHNFPFVRYIVDCQPDVNPPRYLQRGGNVRYDFRPLLEDDFVIRNVRDRRAEDVAEAVAALGVNENDIDVAELARNVEAVGVEVMSGRDWPTHEELKLDDSQYQALHSALTKEFAIVQGPPGTGKTYLGLKILKMLLHNSQAWNDPAQQRPLLIVCYTNHALDQFLEGVLSFFQGKLVRVGARSKSEVLKDKTLSNYRTRAQANKQIPMETHEAKVRAKLELRTLRIDIHEKAAKLEMAEQEIVKEEFLKAFISAKAMQDFKRSLGRHGEDSAILGWLKLEKLHERLLYQAEHRMDKLPPAQVLLAGKSQLSALVRENFEDELEDAEDDDDETVDVQSAFMDSTQARRLDTDEDDDDLLEFEVDFDELDLDKEETESQRLRRRQREVEVETNLLRGQNIALGVSGFCDGNEDEEVRDRTVSKPSKPKDKEVKDKLRKLKLQQKRRLQTLLRSVDKMSLEEAEQVSVWT